jgi:hypothetical protein
MAVISGKAARVGGATNVNEWSISYTRAAVGGPNTATAGAPALVAGNGDWRGSYRFTGKQPPHYPGTSFAFAGYTGAGGGGSTYSGTAIVSEVTIEAPIEEGGSLGGTVTFEADGALTRGAGTQTDVGAPQVFSAKGLQVDYNGAVRPDARGWRLTLATELLPYNSTATGGDTKRGVGNVSASWEWSEYEDLAADLPAAGSIAELKLYVDGSTFFHVKWAIVGDVSADHDVEGGGLVGQTISGSFTGWNGTQGFVAKPTGGNWWP